MLRILVLVFTLVAAPALAQGWPAKPVRIITSLGAGSAVDMVARLIGDRLARGLGQAVVVENVPGAAGVVGAQAAARATPDGYTLFIAPASALTSNLYLFKSLPYDPRKDFAAIGMIVDSGPFVVVVHPDLPVHSLADLIAHARAHPDKLSYAVDVSSGFGMIVAQWMVKASGVRITEIPYKAMAQALQDTISGRTQIVVSSAPATDAFVRAGKLRRLAISSRKRFPSLESLPTIAETLPGVQLEGWFVLVAPTGTPQAVIDRLNRELEPILKDPEIAQKMLPVGLAPSSGAQSPQATAEFVRIEQERWAGIVKELGLQPQ